MKFLIAVTTSLCNLILCCNTYNFVHVRPTHPLNTTCQGCYTLNEWIESGFINNLFANNTIVILLPGNHLIISKRRVKIENVSSLLIIGEQGETVNVSCFHGAVFEFYNVVDIRIAYITFNSCGIESTSIFSLEEYPEIALTLLFVEADGIVITGITVIDGGVIVRESVNGSSFTLRHSKVISAETGLFYSSSLGLKCPYRIPLDWVHILNSTTTIKVTRSPCTRVILQEFEIRDIKYVITAMQIAALWVTLIDVSLCNNYFPVSSNIMANYTDFKGRNVISQNRGNGIVIMNSDVKIYRDSSIHFHNNHFTNMVLSFANCISVKIENAKVAFTNNTVGKGGILIIRSSGGAITKSEIMFVNNTSINFSGTDDTGVMLLRYSIWKVASSNLTFLNNVSPLSGGLTMINSELSIIANVSALFEGNSGQNGGAIALYKTSYIVLVNHLLMQFCHNTALNKGGAIFVEDIDYIDSHTKIAHGHFRAFFVVSGSNYSGIDLKFTDNEATIAGMEIYGGWIDIHEHGRLYSIHHEPQGLSTVASNPTRICMCISSIPACNIITHRVDVFPGETLSIEAVAVGQRMGVVPSIVTANAKQMDTIGDGQDVQSVGKECTTLHYNIYSSRNNEILTLRAQDTGVPKLNFELSRILPSRYHKLFEQFSIMAVIKHCPIGFELRNSECICSTIISALDGVDCDFNAYGIKRTSNIWIYARPGDNTSKHYITLHKHCPYDYCRNDVDSLTIHLENPDKQCAFNRSGNLCGGCQAGLSQVFGSIKCKQCSQIHMVFVIVITAVIAGIALVLFLMWTNLTVSSGMVNGLIFYGNVIRLNQALFFPSDKNNTFMSIFIAWLNLDLGFEACFYDGLDAYAKTWLQFAFPLYIWFIVLSIIFASHYSSTVSKIFGNNAVQVLATLFLLSYVKILRVIVTVVSYTILVYHNGIKERVWLLDGNIHFLDGKHIPLFIASLVMIVFLLILYTLPLVFIQCLQSVSHYRVLFWVHYLKPLFDAYTGPYKHKHRYWIGVTLLLRLVFVLTFSLNFSNDPATKLLTIAIVSLAMLIYISYFKVYKLWMNNVNEISFLLNLVLLSVVTSYQMATGGRLALPIILSTSIAFIDFFLVSIYQGTKQLLTCRRVKYTWIKLQTRVKERVVNRKYNHLHKNEESIKQPCQKITHTSIELTEPLVD